MNLISIDIWSSRVLCRNCKSDVVSDESGTLFKFFSRAGALRQAQGKPIGFELLRC